MSKCRSCNADIIWLKTKTGKHIPCNPVLVKYWQKHGGTKKIVTPDGDVISCETEPGLFDRTADGSGYIPHWSTCPKADDFRRKQS